MGYSINYKGMTLENFDARDDKAARKFAMGRYNHFDTCENDRTDVVVCTKAKFSEKTYRDAVAALASQVNAMVEADMDADEDAEGEKYDDPDQRQQYTEDYLAAAYKDIEDRFNLITFYETV